LGIKRNRNRNEAHKGQCIAHKWLISKIYGPLKAPAKALKGYKKKDFGGAGGIPYLVTTY